MKPSTTLALSAMSCQATARWLAFAPDPVSHLRGHDPSRPTQPAEVNEYEQYAPQPTPPPSEAVVDLLLHRRQRTGSSSSSDNTWVNAQTCGYLAGLSSQPYVCESPLSCSTNTDEVVACATAGVEQFYTVCLNYEAVQSSQCTSAGPQTGCCQDASAPECGTFIWTGTPARSMYKCFPTATLISMLDEPQFVIDASRSSAAAAASSSSAEAASRSEAEAASRGQNGPSTVVATTTAADGSTSTVTSVIGGGASAGAGSGAGGGGGGGNVGGGGDGGSSNHTGAIAGGTIGGIALLSLLALLLWYLMRKSNKFKMSICGGNRKTKKEKNVNNKTYNKRNVKNDNRAYDERSYSNRNSYDNRSYDNSRSYDNNGSNDQGAARYDQSSQSGAPRGPANQHFHFHVDDARYGPSPDSRPPVTQEPPPAHIAGAAAGAPVLSRREQRRLARQQRSQADERDPEKDEFEQGHEQEQEVQTQAPTGTSRSHRYHPSSGQRYPDAPPPAPKAPGPDLDFIGRGI